jgi:ADP-heptose:LPS heptosyltransferase
VLRFLVSRFLIARADAARDDGRHQAAAALYGEALRLDPRRADIHIQRGHMLKEAGEFTTAEHHYLEALRLTPDDADLFLQLGHLYKASARLQEAHTAYEAAARLQPGWETPARELQSLHEAGWRGASAKPADPQEFGVEGGRSSDVAPFGLGAADVGRLAPGLAPRRPDDLLHAHETHIDVRRLGRREAGFWGQRRTLRGVEAIRGFCVSESPILEMHVLLNGVAIHRGPVKGGYEMRYELDKQRIRKYVFNVWLDFSTFDFGLQALELRFFAAHGPFRSFHEDVVIAEPATEAAYPGANALVTLSRDDVRPLEEQIRARPSMVQPARRALFPGGIRNVLVMRTDQLGDMVASIPAVRRLKEIMPGANLVALLTEANADLARTLGVFDDIIVIEFPDDKIERRRLMPLDAQEALRRKLETYAFDIALDLAQASVSRELLLLSGAKFLYGTGGGDWPWLSAEINFNTHDRWNYLDITPHSRKVLALVEGLGALLNTEAPVIRRTDLSRGLLQTYGIGPNERFVVLHAGARIVFSRWPHYPKLAELLLKRTDVKVVMMSDVPLAQADLPPALLSNDRFLYVDQRLSFDQFDAFISFATVVVGNDSGPKHLASLRGTNVVTLFTARINWQEWGQENVGVIISRRVPCAGCAIFHDDEECGKDFTCIVDIRPEEVFTAVKAYIPQPERVAA